MFYTYILFSKKINKFYVGYCENLTIRLERHNAGWGKFTKRGIPWEIKYYETYENKSDAIKREIFIKKKKSRKYILYLIENKN